jgi:hypothetical protein
MPRFSSSDESRASLDIETPLTLNFSMPDLKKTASLDNQIINEGQVTCLVACFNGLDILPKFVVACRNIKKKCVLPNLQIS